MISRRITLKTAFVSLLAYIMPNTFSKASNDQTLYTVNGEKITYKQFMARYAQSEDIEQDYVQLEFTSEEHRIRVHGVTKYTFYKKLPPVYLFKRLQEDPDIKVIKLNKSPTPSKGFTLIELLVVIMVSVVLIALGLNAYYRISGGDSETVIVTQFGETYFGRLISEDPNSVTIKTTFGKTVTITQPYTISK